MKTVYLVRHGESEANVAPVFQEPTSPLNLDGQKQASRIAERAKNIPFDVLISSPFTRARMTAEEIAKATGKQPEFSELFVERIKPSSINGKPYSDEHANAVWREWDQSLSTPGLRVEDGENYEDLVARADRALSYLHERAEETALVVTHGYFLRAIIARVLLKDALTPLAFKNLQMSARIQNTGITVLKFEPGFEAPPDWRLETYNDHAHLG